MKRLLFVILVFLATFCFVQNAKAVDTLSVDCSTGCIKSGIDPLFSLTGDGVWYPGRVLTKRVYLKNSSPAVKEMAMGTNKTSSTGALEEKMSVILTKTGGIPVIWTGSLKGFIDQSKITFGNFDAGASSLYDLSVTFDPLANNDYQGKEVVFDMKLGFWTEETEGGSVQGTSTAGGAGSAPPCTDTKPGTPINFSVVSGPNPDQATLSWTGVSPFTSFLIAYSDNNLSPKWGNPDVGSGSSYTVSGLGSGTYYFWVRGQNGCMPGDFAGPVSISTGIAGGTFTQLPGFSENTLGVSTPSAEVAGESNGETKGASACDKCIWWQILLLELVGLLVVGRVIAKKRILLATIPLLAYLIFWLLNRNCPSNLIFCQLFWLLDILVYLFYLILPGFGFLKPKSD